MLNKIVAVYAGSFKPFSNINLNIDSPTSNMEFFS